MTNIYYTQDHEWVLVEGDSATVGITNFAQEQLGDIVFVDLPETGSNLTKGDEVGVIESVKTASDLYSPISGTVTAINDTLEQAPDTVNANAESSGWLFKMTISDQAELEQLMDEAAYKNHIA